MTLSEDNFMAENVFTKFVYGLFVLVGKSGDKESGCIINTAIQASSKPEDVLCCVTKDSYTGSLIKESGIFNLSILDETANFDLFKRFGFQSGKDVDKFDGFADKARSENGLYYLTAMSNAFLSIKVSKTVDLGSHWLFIGDVTQSKVLNNTLSVSYQYYFDYIKPAEPAAKTEGRVAWKCKICGYIYDDPYLPADFICPICKHPAEDFEKIYL